MDTPPSLENLEKLLEDLPVDAGMPHPEFFVGREDELGSLRGSFRGRQSGSRWLTGPRRVGKTSIAQRIGEDDRIDAIQVSAPLLHERSADALIRFVAGRLGLKTKQGALTAHLSTLERPLVAVVDEFDEFCLNLQRDEQAKLRALAHDNALFAWLFVSRAPPSALCRKYDEQSWLLGICTPQRVGLLPRVAVSELVQRVCCRAGFADDADEVSDAILTAVAGYGAAVQRLLRGVLEHRLKALRRKRPLPPLRESVVLRPELRDLLDSLWIDLPLSVRRPLVLKDFDGALESAIDADLVDEWDDAFAPAWLVDVGCDLGLVPRRGNGGAIGPAEAILERMDVIHERSRLLGQPFFKVGQSSMLKLHSLARPPSTEAELQQLVSVLYRVFRESTIDPETLEMSRLRDACHAFRSTPFWRAINTPRHIRQHDPDTGPEGSKRRRDLFVELRAACERYTGRPECMTERDYTSFHSGLLRDLGHALELVGANLEG